MNFDVTRKADIRLQQDNLQNAVVDLHPGSYIFSSGGTSSEPVLSYIPGHMFIDEILREWSPLEREDVFSNAFRPGKLWSAHYFYHLLGQKTAGLTISYGAPDGDDEIVGWSKLMASRRMTALASTPTGVLSFVKVWIREGIRMEHLRKILWVGEPFQACDVEYIKQALPNVSFYGLYGSTETWVIATNGPQCDSDLFHPLSHQSVDIREGEILITTRHPDNLNQIQCYAVGDRGEFGTCKCGRPGDAIRILDRIGEPFKFRGHLIDPSSVKSLIRSLIPDAECQLILDSSIGSEHPLTLNICTKILDLPGTDHLRKLLLGQHLDLANSFLRNASELNISYVQDLLVNARTGKTLAVVRR